MFLVGHGKSLNLNTNLDFGQQNRFSQKELIDSDRLMQRNVPWCMIVGLDHQLLKRIPIFLSQLGKQEMDISAHSFQVL